MNHNVALRVKNALVAGGAAICGLAGVSCWIGFPLAFLAFPFWILSALLLGLTFGGLLYVSRVRWSLLLGGLIGILTGGTLALRVLSHI